VRFLDALVRAAWGLATVVALARPEAEKRKALGELFLETDIF
jgi:hypothetical protein